MIMLYICFGLSAVFSLIMELKKPQKNQFLILVDSLVLLGAFFLVGSIFI
ncbi:amino acid transporter (plasmid) [Bacillus cereus]|nr:amino acid transporter [Bacillus cereus]